MRETLIAAFCLWILFPHLSATGEEEEAESTETSKPIPVAEVVSESEDEAVESDEGAPDAEAVAATESILSGSEAEASAETAEMNGQDREALLLSEEEIDEIEKSMTKELGLGVEESTVSVDLEAADQNEDGVLSQRERFLQSHREQLKIYDLNDDKRISEEEWRAANEDARERDAQFYLIDKDENGQIDSDEAVRFLVERVSIGKTYVDVTEEANLDEAEKIILDAAPSEVRVTVFSIPLGK
ncbi:MAG: hypothetical protein AAF236_12195 [Verrucomicrobiota bacterium]